MLKGCQSVRAELIFTPTQVASYDFILPITLNNLPAPTPAPTPMPRTPFSSSTTLAADFGRAAKLASATGTLVGAEESVDGGKRRRSPKSRSSDAGGSGSGSGFGSGSGSGGDAGSSAGRSGTITGAHESGTLSGAGPVESEPGERVTPKRRIVATALRQPLEISASSLDFLLPATFIKKLEKHGPEAYAKILTKVPVYQTLLEHTLYLYSTSNQYRYMNNKLFLENSRYMYIYSLQ